MPRKKACDSCHVKKIHCDGAEPHCEWCTYRGLICTYGRTASRKRGKPRWKSLERPENPKHQNRKRIARLKDLIGNEVQQHDVPHGSHGDDLENPANEETTFDRLTDKFQSMLSLPQQGLFYSSAMHFAGFDLDDLTAQLGIPVFCKDGLRWIQDKTGASELFKDFYRVRDLDNETLQQSQLTANLPNEIPSKSVAIYCLQVFNTSSLQRAFPVIEVESFAETIEHAYEHSERTSTVSLCAQACVRAFMAVMTLLEPTQSLLSPAEADECARQAQGSLLEILSRPSVEALQAALMLCMYHDTSGTIRLAALVHSLAVQCVYSLGAHLNQEESSYPGASKHLRGLFWVSYFFDRHISLRTGRPALYNNHECSLSTDGYQGFTAIHEPDVPLFPGDIDLTILKSEVSLILYSSSASQKSDAELLQDIRLLDDRLEDWRLSVPEPARPSLSIVNFGTSTATNFVGEEHRTWVVFMNLEYLYLISAIHRACGRCTTQLRENDGSEAINSSLFLSVYASRATLSYLAAASENIHGAMFWLILFYPIWAAITIFNHVLQNPTADSTLADISLLQAVPQILTNMHRKNLGIDEIRHLSLLDAFIAELVRLALCAVERAGKVALVKKQV